TPPLSYQWRRDGTNITGANSPVYSIPTAQVADSGNYEVIVTNLYGSVTGQQFTVTVSPLSKPAITEDPQSRTLYPGGIARFQVGATGGQLHFEWRKGGVNVSGANQSFYILGSVVTADSGFYSVLVTNPLGSITSSVAVLTVATPAPGSFEAAIVADGPESWWRLDEAPGSTNMFDSFGRHDGTYT